MNHIRLSKTFLLIIITLVLTNFSAYTQNKLSPIWKISSEDQKFESISTIRSTSWDDINLSLSWERQGYSEIDGDCAITNSFFVKENDSPLQLELNLQCLVKAIYINQQLLSDDQIGFSESDKNTILNIPTSLIKKNETNQIVLLISNLAYTGGLSNNFCSIHTEGDQRKQLVSLSFPTDNHLYEQNTDNSFLVKTDLSEDGTLKLIVNDDFHKTWIKKEIPVKKGTNEYTFDWTSYNLQPGFYECVAIVDNGTFQNTVQWFTLQPEDIDCTNTTVDDFDEYWGKALNELKAVDPNFKMHKVDSLCSETRDGYVVEMQSLGDLTIRGYYFVPKTGDSHPVVLHLPPYGSGFEFFLGSYMSREGNTAELALCVRGHGISADVFNPWNEMPLWAVNICSKENNIYRSIFMDCVRGVDFLLSRPEIDHSKIGVDGGSQGGGLALATAGLCGSNIAACAFFDPFLCDTRDQIQIRTMIKKEFKSFLQYPGNDCDVNQILAVQDYVDSKGFASKIKCPVYFATSLFDDDCPSHCGFSAYNSITTKKKFEIFPHDSHMGQSGQFLNTFYEAEKILTAE